MAAEQARSMEDGRERRELLEALLRGPYDKDAPSWLLEAAVDSDLARKPPQSDPLYGPSMDLALLAISHPSCTGQLRHESLRRCTAVQLGRLGSAQASGILADGVAEALRERGPRPQGMTVDLLGTPTDAQLVLRQHRLHSTVITAAVDLLPSFPFLDEKGEEDTARWLERQEAAERAWRTMWKQVVTAHPEHHRLLVDWSDNNKVGYIVREHLLGSIPWDVEPELLQEIARDDLASFPLSVLTTRMCRMRRDGATEQKVREHFANDVAELLPPQRKRIDRLLSDDKYGLRYGCRAAISRTALAADGKWRYILNPDQAQKYGRPHPWRASEDQLASLAQQFAEHAAVALELWEPDPDAPVRTAEDLRWVRDLLQYLPVVTPEVKEKTRLLCREARRGLARRRDYGRYGLDSDIQRALELLDTIERMTADPLPDPGPERTASLGKPDQVTVRDLAAAPDAVLDDYLRRHQGNDALVERALLAFASRTYHRDLSFADVLKRHSDPQRALLDLTQSLRRRLGGGPNLRETWVTAVLSLPTTGPELIRALPAWTALKARGPRGQAAHPAVTSVVRTALGDNAEAWQRFATSPASHAGPTAWLRLGDLLDAAANGTPWPAAPHK
ncbi:hypothetical protein OG735_23525 [Streptomyces sp. NBC_01210]|uniref:hypothetical protein n=1 Tax=Streptomyces sp. NBC_01210 TaxID=2903774 RepID=UPI002E116605|nr:hypothetical protein OG735_23525 [Streptomyces sp. NBC_01210]